MERKAALRRAGLVVLAGNAILVLAKAIVWNHTGSLAVGSEAVNSLTDFGYSLVILGGLYLTTRPPDLEHPHGHERIEPFVSLFVAAAIFVAGAAIFWSALTSIRTGSIAVPRGPAAAAVLLFSGLLKYAMFRYCLRIGRANNSPAVTATAVDNRNDILASGAALVGVLGAQAGYPVLDPVAAVAVAGAIVYTGIEVVRDNVNYLVGAAPPDDLRAEIVRRALAHPEVEGVHDVVAHYVGPEIDVSLHIEVEGERTLLEAHEIESAVIESIRALEEVDDVFVHVDPRELGEWKEDYAEQLAARDGE